MLPSVGIKVAPVFRQAVKPVDARPVFHKGRLDILYNIPDFSHVDGANLFLRLGRSEIDLADPSLFYPDGGVPVP